MSRVSDRGDNRPLSGGGLEELLAVGRCHATEVRGVCCPLFVLKESMAGRRGRGRNRPQRNALGRMFGVRERMLASANVQGEKDRDCW